MSKWEPIETAPKDGTWVLGYEVDSVSACPFAVVRWLDDWAEAWDLVDKDTGKRRMENFGYWGGGGEIAPTHWMPLPDPPALNEQSLQGEG